MIDKRKSLIICPICGDRINESQSNLHIKSCEIVCRNKDNIIELYNSSFSLIQIGEYVGVYWGWISRYLKKWGITVTCRIYDVNHNFFDDMKEQQYWLIGLFASDGSISKNGVVGVSQSGYEGLRTIKYVNTLIENERPIKVSKTSRQLAYSIRFSSKKIVDILSKYNIVPNKTQTYTFPANIPDQYLYAFINGYLLGDGGVYLHTRPYQEYIGINFVGTNEFIEVCQQKIPITGKIIKLRENLSQLGWFGKKAILFGDWCFSSPTLFQSYKSDLFHYMKGKYTNKSDKYNILKQQAMDLYRCGKSVPQITKELNISNRLYEWIKHWKKEGLV